MSMEINERYSQYQTDYAERLKTEQEKAKGTEKGQQDEKASNKIPVPHDEYISREKSDAGASGLYRFGEDKDGRKKIFFDDPKKSGHADENGHPKVKPDHPEKPAEMLTINTDKVDREIKLLKEEKRQLEQQIQLTAGDEEKAMELEKKLAQVESELRQKDNDTYRRQNAFVVE